MKIHRIDSTFHMQVFMSMHDARLLSKTYKDLHALCDTQLYLLEEEKVV